MATKNIIDAYTTLAPVYEGILGSTYMVAPKEIEMFFDSLPKESRILDAGCGPGIEAKAATQRGHTVLGLDITPSMVERFRRTLPGSEAIVGDIAAIPLADASVDAVFAASSLLHLPKEKGGKAIAEIARVLKPGGAFLIATMVGNGEGDYHSREVLTKAGVESLYFFYWEKLALQGALESNGLCVSSWKEIELVPNRPQWAFITGIRFKKTL